jgi:uncharacterized protein
MLNKICPRCNRPLTESDFYRNKNTRDGLTSACKDCLRAGKSPNGNSYKGFASMSYDQLQAAVKAGGKKVHDLGTGHEFTTDEARKAGKKGGIAHARKRMQEGDSRK